jgi:hypothetical protein
MTGMTRRTTHSIPLARPERETTTTSVVTSTAHPAPGCRGRDA